MWIQEMQYSYDISFYYTEELKNAVKKIPGAQWVPNMRVWRVPKDQAKKVKAFYDRYYIKSMAAAPIQKGTIPDLPELRVDVPLLRKPFPYQDNGIAYLLAHERAISGDQPGLGKTTQAIGANVATGAFPTLIICPNTLKLNWRQEWATVAGKRAIILDDTVAKTWQYYFIDRIADVAIVNYESIKKFFVSHINAAKDKPWKSSDVVFNEKLDLFKTVIIDELHKCKDPKTQWTKYCLGITKNKRYVYGLTGTPIVNKTEDLRAQLTIVGRIKDFGGWDYFYERYCATDNYLEELQYRLRTICFYQRKKSDVLKDLPDKMRQIMLCDITTRKEYDAAVRDLEQYLRNYRSRTDEEIEKSLRGAIMVQMNLCREISARGKLNEVFEFVDELTESGEKVVVFFHQKIIRDRLKERYPHAVTVTGDDTAEERNTNIHLFQTMSSCNIILCSIKAAGVGITLTASSEVLFVEWPWHPADADQCEDRTHRIGQVNKVRATYFLGNNTVDQRMYQLIEEKRALGGTITGNTDLTFTEIIDGLTESLLNGQVQQV